MVTKKKKKKTFKNYEVVALFMPWVLCAGTLSMCSSHLSSQVGHPPSPVCPVLTWPPWQAASQSVKRRTCHQRVMQKTQQNRLNRSQPHKRRAQQMEETLSPPTPLTQVPVSSPPAPMILCWRKKRHVKRLLNQKVSWSKALYSGPCCCGVIVYHCLFIGSCSNWVPTTFWVSEWKCISILHHYSGLEPKGWQKTWRERSVRVFVL